MTKMRVIAALAAALLCAPAFGQSQFPAHTTWGNPTASTALPKAMTQAEVAAMCNTFTSLLVGCVPASGGGTANFLRADGTWALPSGGVAGSIAVGTTTVTGGTSLRVLYDNAGVLGEYTNTQLTALCNSFTSSLSGCAPLSGGGTTNFLRADGSWSAPGGTSAIDVFLAIGASNTVGQGSSASSPVPPTTARMYCVGTGNQPLADPVCSAVNAAQDANTGSMWPAFAIAYGRPVGIVQAAVSGSTQSVACDLGAGAGNWEATTAGSNFANSITAIDAAMTAFRAAGYVPTFRGVFISDLGGNDALQIDSSACTAAQYSAGYVAMAANYRAATIDGSTFPHMPIFAALVGTDTNAAISDSGFAQVRAKQLANTLTDGNFLIVYDDLPSFGVRGLMQANSTHMTQAGYNVWGYNVGGSILPFVPLHNVNFMTINNNASGALPIPVSSGYVLQIGGPDGVQGGYEVFGFGAPASGLLRGASGTNAAPTGPTTGTFFGLYNAKSYGSTGWPSLNQGAIGFKATENHDDTHQGTATVLFCTPNTTVAPKVCGTFDQNGNLNLGLAGTYTAALNLTGATSGTVTAQVQAAAGTYNWNYPTTAGTSGQPLLSGGGGATAMTFGTLGISGGGTGVTTGTAWLESAPITVDFSVAGDNAITVPLPSGFTRLAFCGVIISGASADISAANFGVWTNTGGTGGNLIAAATAITVTATADNTNNNTQVTNCANVNTESYTPNAGTVQFRVGATAASGRTAKVTMRYNPIP